MNRYDNPFHDLWLTEKLDPVEFSKVFSPVVAKATEDLFGTANIVLKGRQGSGKSMLLNLFDTKKRVAFERNNIEYPIPKEKCNFISANIHLIKSNIKEVNTRIDEIDVIKQTGWIATIFSDLLNYYLIYDLLLNIQYLGAEQAVDGVLAKEVKVSLDPSNVNLFIELITQPDVFCGYINDIKSFDELLQKVRHRISEYRKYFNFNSDEIPDDILKSRTSIGEPIALLSEALTKSNILPPKTIVYLHIDQHEELYELEKGSSYSSTFRQVVNRALAMRDHRISYRIGTRNYSWNEDLKVYGSGAVLERMRDYVEVDIDEILRSRENRSTAKLYREFAADVFARRLDLLFDGKIEKSKILEEVFGKTMTPKERAITYAKNKTLPFSLSDSYSPEWKLFIQNLWEVDPLDAKFADCWLRQEKQQKIKLHKEANPEENAGWRKKEYWIKERKEAALVQIAGASKEMLIWSGSNHIISLSGWNILAFMTLCRAIWASWLRNASDKELESITFPRISWEYQALGVHEASRIWNEKLREGARGEDRNRFIRSIGTWIAYKLRQDRALSNPGHTGFSLAKSDFENGGAIAQLIKYCRDQGDLIESEHTPKNISAKHRIKWHLNPLLCPHFRIPHIRTKEPIYSTCLELTKIYQADYKKIQQSEKEEDQPIQQNLF